MSEQVSSALNHPQALSSSFGMHCRSAVSIYLRGEKRYAELPCCPTLPAPSTLQASADPAHSFAVKCSAVNHIRASALTHQEDYPSPMHIHHSIQPVEQLTPVLFQL